jgi:hypothetical protein
MLTYIDFIVSSVEKEARFPKLPHQGLHFTLSPHKLLEAFQANQRLKRWHALCAVEAASVGKALLGR